MSAREDILARIHAALGTQPSAEAGSPSAEVTPHDADATQGGAAVGAPDAAGDTPTVGYRTMSALTEDELVAQLVDRLEDYKARVEVVDAEVLPEAIRTRLEGKTFVAPVGLPSEWIHPSLAERTVTDSRQAPLGVERLDAVDAVVTSSAVSIAETGTIVLDGSPDQGRRAISLVPDHHVCVVPVETIVGLVPEGFARLDITRPLTLISGPSATSDIELERVEGVHGPRMLDVLIVR